ncbi:MAG: S-methyl-5-thioribose-1-phosphate isomerase [Deltaproteobacteria bacterium]|nr:S-methyl-5-thioribose-1-phosphate isomerase [Deltaproteobacteria bacterium]
MTSRIELVRPRGLGFDAVLWEDGEVRILDQRRLPTAVVELPCRTVEEVAEAIRTLAVRGAPLIGVAAAYALALAARQAAGGDGGARKRQALLEQAAATLRATRPTAVNLFWAIERMLHRSRTLAGLDDHVWAGALLDEAQAVHAEDRASCREIGRHGATLVPEEGGILTHCNTGGLATGGFGTAAGIIRAAVAAGRKVRVYVDETRPLLQGARLTAWELAQDGIPVTLLCDSMAAFAMSRGFIDMVVVGADRIAANGDTANKIGTYSVAVAARHHGIPFYVAAPSSTFDLALATGRAIPIEERQADEVRTFCGVASAPAGVAVWNPSFDVTPAQLITAIVAERGIARPPYQESLARLLEGLV